MSNSISRSLVSVALALATLVGCGDNFTPPAPDAHLEPDAQLVEACRPAASHPGALHAPCECEPSGELCATIAEADHCISHGACE